MSRAAVVSKRGRVDAPAPSVSSSGLDMPMCVAMGVLLTMGLVMVYSSSAAYANRLVGDPTHFITKQLVWCGAGVFIAWMATQVSVLSLLARKSGWLMVLATIMCAIVLLDGVGVRVNNARRWLNLASPAFSLPSLRSSLSLFLRQLFLRN